MRGMTFGEFIPLDDDKIEQPSEPAEADPVRKVSLYMKHSHYRAIRQKAAAEDRTTQDVLDEILTGFFKA